MDASRDEVGIKPPVETYEQAIDFLFGRINYERIHSGSYSTSDFKLDRMRQLLSLLSDPHECAPVVHVAGTKGKGSTAVMIAEMLGAAGYRVGLFTSPHISRFEERMTVEGIPPSPARLVELAERVAGPVSLMDRSPGPMDATYFEIATAMAWLYFAEKQVDLAVLEVGLGGRLDATNICNPEVAVITNISRDHTALLGGTLPQIAREKAGIIKSGVPVISGVSQDEARRVIVEVCRRRRSELIELDRECRYQYRPGGGPQEKGTGVVFAQPTEPRSVCQERTPVPFSDVVDVDTPWHRWPGVPMPLTGEHQARNAALAVGVVDLLSERGWTLPSKAVYEGMARVRWPLRIEVVRNNPTVIVDAAHNWASVAALLQVINSTFAARRRILVFATTKDKDVCGLLRQLLPEFDTVILTQYLNNPRAVPVAELHRTAQAIAEYPVHPAGDPAAAWKLASCFSGPADLVCVTGSFFIAAEIRDIVIDSPQQTDDDGETTEQTTTLCS